MRHCEPGPPGVMGLGACASEYSFGDLPSLSCVFNSFELICSWVGTEFKSGSRD